MYIEIDIRHLTTKIRKLDSIQEVDINIAAEDDRLVTNIGGNNIVVFVEDDVCTLNVIDLQNDKSVWELHFPIYENKNKMG